MLEKKKNQLNFSKILPYREQFEQPIVQPKYLSKCVYVVASVIRCVAEQLTTRSSLFLFYGGTLEKKKISPCL